MIKSFLRVFCQFFSPQNVQIKSTKDEARASHKKGQKENHIYLNMPEQTV